MSSTEKNCSTKNENDKNDQTSSEAILKDQSQENATSIQAVLLSKKGSCTCLCTMPLILVLLTAPNFVMMFAYTITSLDGSLSRLVELLLSSPLDILHQIWWPYILGNNEAWSIIVAFVLFEFLLMMALPGHRYTGSITPKGNVPHYKDNGLLALLAHYKDNGLLAIIITIAGLGLLVYYDIFIPSLIYNNFMYLIGALNLLGLTVSVILFIKGKYIYLPSSIDVTDTGLVSGFFQGKTSPRRSTHVSPLPTNKLKSPRHSSHTISNRITNSHSSDKLDHHDGQALTHTQLVLKELVTTERDYVKDLASIMESYYVEMEPNNVNVPLKLRGKRQAVFGNLDEIYEFHKCIFLKELEKYNNSPEDVGQCFLNHSANFRLYENYCKNRSDSNALLQCSSACEAFLKDIQVKLGHRLPLSSYLMKPVQRITKYQLFLKELMDKCVDSEIVFASLKKAFDEMIKILQHLNQAMKVVGLKGFPGNLVDQGRLLAQEKFHIVDSTTKGALHMFARSKERHVFLFEEVLVLTKKVTSRIGDCKKHCSPSFMYKEHYLMTDISLREVDDHKTCLHLTVFGQNKPIVLQAPSQQIKETWESEIHRLLELQFTLLKEQALMSPTRRKRTFSGPFASTLKRRATLAQSESPATVVKPLINTPTTSAQNGSTGLCDDEVDFNSNGGDGIDDKEKLSGTSSSISDEDNITYESLVPGAHKWYKATSDYSPGTTDNDVALVEDQIVELLGVSQVGWWWVRATKNNNEVQEGWVPASYLQMCSN